MTPFILAQTSDPVSQAINDVYLQYGALALLALVAFIIVFRIWQNSEAARTKAIEVETSRKIEDTKRDTLISDLAEKQGKTSDELRQVVVELAESRGQVKLLDSQLQNERDKRQKEAIEFNERFANISKQYEALKEEHNGKTALIASQDLEISQLNSQLHDEQSKNTRLENTLKEVTIERDNLKKTVSEQAEQIISLANQLVLVDPAKSGDTDKMKAVSVTTTTTTEISDGTKEFSQLSDKDNPS